MTTFSDSQTKSQNPSKFPRERLLFVLWKIILPLAILALLFFVDYPIRAVVRDHQTPFLTTFYDIIKYFGNVIIGFALSVILICAGKFTGKERLLRAGKLMLVSLILANLIVVIAKPMLNIHHRNEMVPAAEQDHDATRWGRFPSGDATVVFTIAASLSAVFPALFIPTFAIGVLVAVERVYFNLHFFSDVFAGAWLGIVVVSLVRKKYFPAEPKSLSNNEALDNRV